MRMADDHVAKGSSTPRLPKVEEVAEVQHDEEGGIEKGEENIQLARSPGEGAGKEAVRANTEQLETYAAAVQASPSARISIDTDAPYVTGLPSKRMKQKRVTEGQANHMRSLGGGLPQNTLAKVKQQLRVATRRKRGQ